MSALLRPTFRAHAIRAGGGRKARPGLKGAEARAGTGGRGLPQARLAREATYSIPPRFQMPFLESFVRVGAGRGAHVLERRFSVFSPSSSKNSPRVCQQQQQQQHAEGFCKGRVLPAPTYLHINLRFGGGAVACVCLPVTFGLMGPRIKTQDAVIQLISAVPLANHACVSSHTAML